MNVILLTADALRADHLTCYGYNKETSPFLSERLTNEAAWFSHCYATSNMTAASTPSILSGTYPLDYGGYHYLSSDRTLISEALSEAGFETAAFHTNVNYVPERNYDRGFDYVFSRHDASRRGYHIKKKVKRAVSRFVPNNTIRSLLSYGSKAVEKRLNSSLSPDEDAETIINAGKSWLEGNGADDSFLWLHFMDTHNPFMPPDDIRTSFLERSISEERMWELNKKYTWSTDPYTDQDVEDLMSLYDAMIRYLDKTLESFFDWISETCDDTAVIFTADHGELFGEKGKIGHGPSFHEGVIRVPFFLWGPNVTPGQYDEVISTLDIGKTLLDFADVEPPDSYRGYSARPLVKSGGSKSWGREVVITESGHAANDPQVHKSDRRDEWRICARDGRSRLVYHVDSDFWTKDTEWTLYNAATNTWEDLNCEPTSLDSDSSEKLAEAIRAHIRRVNATNEGEYRDSVDLSGETEDQLKDLGYI